MPAIALGAGALGLIALLAGGALVALATSAGDGSSVLADPYLWRVARFTLLQAGLSALLSVTFAIPVARALARRTAFPGRASLMRIFALPMALPQLVAVLGIVAVWGQQGWASDLLRLGGATNGIDVYGLQGILVAHVFFNMPLAARLLVSSLERIPGEHWRLAGQLGMKSSDIFRLVEWPLLKARLPGVAALVFMLCAASFTVVLTLGGGPAATTIEVAIYQALRFDFDPQRAVSLALMQLALCALLFLLGGRLAVDVATGAGLGRPVPRPDLVEMSGRASDATAITLAALYLLLPLAAILLSGLTAPLGRLISEESVWKAGATSLAVSTAAGLSSLALAWCLLTARRAIARSRRPPAWQRAVDLAMTSAGSLILVVPPIVLGAGWFVALHGMADVFSLAPALVVAANALMALPFVLRILGPAMSEVATSHERLSASLGLSGWNRFRLVDLPVLAPPFGLALALAMAMSLGDLGVIALFGNADFVTLPLLLLQRMGSYRTDDAAGLALILALGCLMLVWIADRRGSVARIAA